MPGLQICRSNRSELLVHRLAEDLRTNPLSDPIATEPVVVHSPGMGRWLSMVLSQQIGICANVDFPFPAKVFRMAMSRALAAFDARERARIGQTAPALGDPADDTWNPDRLTWALLQVLPGLRDQLDPAVQEYLAASVDGTVRRKEYLLARRLANLFDDYANYRPEWITAWDRGLGITVGDRPVAPDAPGGQADWQPRLWRTLAAAMPGSHPASRIDDAIRALIDPTLAIDDLPTRLSLFGISTLPPSFVRVLVALSRRIDVRIYALSPSHRYFGDMLTDDEAARNLARHIDSTDEDEHHYGHPLLKSLGRLGRDFHRLLTDAEDIALADVENGPEPVIDEYEEPADANTDGAPDTRPTMLRTLQSDILNLRHRRPGGSADNDEAPIALPESDGSIRFHACHGALRQVEVLRDELLRLLKADPTLQARDIVVMSPDIDTFAPLIDAVFSDGEPHPAMASQGAGFPSVHFRIADRSARQTNVAAEIVSRVLGLATGRLPASDVLDLLALEPVRIKFGLEIGDLESIHGWVAASGLRWGMDEHHRKAQAQPQDRANTWRFGLDRLLLGFAMPGDGQRTFADVLPFDDVEGTSSRTLGRFVRFCETLFDATVEIQGTRDPMAFQAGGMARTPGGWEALVRRVVDAFVDLPPKQYWRIRKTLDVFRDLVHDAGAVGCERVLDLDTVRTLIDERMGASTSTAALLAGGVNFCAMVPMRTIPFRVVCLLGMDDGVFPRQQRRMGFDLLGRHPSTGDRSPRDDDRHLFLEAILAARDHLIVTFNGRSIRDNSDLPPSVPVGELLDVLADTFALPGKDFEDRRRGLVTKQHLQAFSIENFRHDGSRGFDRRAMEGAEQLLQVRKPNPAFFTAELPDLFPGDQVVSVDQMARFFQNPTRYLLQQRLSIRLDDQTAEIADREPVELDGLQGWAVGDEVLRALLAGQDPDAVRDRIRRQGRVPLGVPGELVLEHIRTEAQDIFERAAPLLEGEHVTREASIDIGGLAIRGTLDDVWAAGQVLVQYGTIRARQVLAAWLKHLLACSSNEPFAGVTTLVGRSNTKDWGSSMTFQGVGGGVGIGGVGGGVGVGSVVGGVGVGGGVGVDLQTQARGVLADLAGLYRYGWRRPLLLFPESSGAYAREFFDARLGTDPDAAGRKEATSKWKTGENAEFPNEDADLYYQRVLQGAVPWDPDFELPGLSTDADFRPEQLALRVWKPILAAVRAGQEVA